MNISHLIHLIFYIIGLIFCLYGLLSEEITNEFIDKLKKQPEKILYFSYNALILTIAMIIWGILAIFTLPFKQINHHIRRIHSLNAYITFGSETIVVLVYWPLNYVNNIPDFLLPYKDNHILPPLKQFSIHIFPFIICIIEVFTCRINRGYLKYFGMLLVGIIYIVILIVYIQLYGSPYPYNFMYKTNLLYIPLLNLVLTSIAIISIKFISFIRELFQKKTVINE